MGGGKEGGTCGMMEMIPSLHTNLGIKSTLAYMQSTVLSTEY